MKKQIGILMLAGLLIAGCAGPSETAVTVPDNAPLSADDKASIDVLTANFEAAFKAGDVAALGALYTEDAVLYPPNEPPVTGRAAIIESFGSFPPLKDFVIDNKETEGYGDMAYTRGTAILTIAGPEGEDIVMHGKYIDIRRKQSDGSWLYSRDIFNFDAPTE